MLAAYTTESAASKNSYASICYFPLKTFCAHVRSLIRSENPENGIRETRYRLLTDRENFSALLYQHIAGEIAEEDRKHIAPAHSRSAAAEFRSLRKLPAAQSNAWAREIIDIRPLYRAWIITGWLWELAGLLAICFLTSTARLPDFGLRESLFHHGRN